MARNIQLVTGPRYSPQTRAEAMADALTARALRPRAPQQGGPVQVAMSPWEGVAQLGEAFIANRVGSRATKLAEAEQERVQAANQKLVGQLGGYKDAPRRIEDRAPMPGFGQPTGAPIDLPEDMRVPTDKAEKLAAAIAGMDPSAANAALSGVSLQRLLADPEAEEAYTLGAGQRRYKGRQLIAEVPSDAPKQPSEVQEYEYYARQAQATGKQPISYDEWRLQGKRAGAASTNVNLPYDNKWAAATAENDAKRLDDLRVKADSARGALRSVQRLRQLNPGAAAGGTAEARTAAANILAGLGFNIDPKLAASQEFDAIASRMVIDSLGGSLGTGFSNADRDFVTRTVPQIGHSMEARTKLLNFIESKFNDQIRDYNQADAYARQHNGLQGYNPNPPVTKVYNPVTGQIEDAPQ